MAYLIYSGEEENMELSNFVTLMLTVASYIVVAALSVRFGVELGAEEMRRYCQYCAKREVRR